MTKEQQLLIDIACYFSERAVEESGINSLRSEIYDEVANIVGNWLKRSRGVYDASN